MIHALHNEINKRLLDTFKEWPSTGLAIQEIPLKYLSNTVINLKKSHFTVRS